MLKEIERAHQEEELSEEQARDILRELKREEQAAGKIQSNFREFLKSKKS